MMQEMHFTVLGLFAETRILNRQSSILSFERVDPNSRKWESFVRWITTMGRRTAAGNKFKFVAAELVALGAESGGIQDS